MHILLSSKAEWQALGYQEIRQLSWGCSLECSWHRLSSLWVPAHLCLYPGRVLRSVKLTSQFQTETLSQHHPQKGTEESGRCWEPEVKPEDSLWNSCTVISGAWDNVSSAASRALRVSAQRVGLGPHSCFAQLDSKTSKWSFMLFPPYPPHRAGGQEAGLVSLRASATAYWTSR